MLKQCLIVVSLFLPQLSFACESHHAMHSVSGTSSKAVEDMHNSMEKMHEGMKNFEASGNPDVDFMRMMIPHHQGAIDMVRAYLKHAKDPQIRSLAEKMANDQEKEIAEMKTHIEKLTRQTDMKKKKK